MDFQSFHLQSNWANAFLATALVSLLPNLLLFLLPDSLFAPDSKSAPRKSLKPSKMLLMFAIAGLLGDVFIHTLPHMLSGGHDHHDHQHHHVAPKPYLSSSIDCALHQSHQPNLHFCSDVAHHAAPSGSCDHKHLEQEREHEQHEHDKHGHEHKNGHHEHEHEHEHEHDHHEHDHHEHDNHEHDNHEHDNHEHDHHEHDHHEHDHHEHDNHERDNHEHDNHKHDHHKHDHHEHDHHEHDHHEHDHHKHDHHEHDHHEHDHHEHDHNEQELKPRDHDNDHHDHKHHDHKHHEHSHHDKYHQRDHQKHRTLHEDVEECVSGFNVEKSHITPAVHDSEGHDHNLHHPHHSHSHEHSPSSGHTHSIHDKELWVPLLVLLGFLLFFLAEKFAQHFINRPGSDHQHDNEGDHHRHHGLQAAGWLNLVADSLHNFSDGITIGAAFATGRGLAFATFLSVIIHEIPHELGDLTILVRSGLSKFAAIRLQFVTALAAFLGTAVGLYLADDNELVQNILLSITAGGFVYIGTVSSLPEILRNSESDSLAQVFGEVICFLLGVGMMVAVALLE